MNILLTGGAGYVGSHTALVLLNAGFDVVVIDNFANASREAVARVERLADRSMTLVEADVRDREAVASVLRDHAVEAVIHCAGLKAVGESTRKPLAYYQTNIDATIALATAMDRVGVKTLVFSSSATVYGDPAKLPIAEDAPVGRPTNPYGWSKLMIEQILFDLQAAAPDWSIALLRYFNPVGAHASGRIGEDPSDIPNNLMPYITQVAVGRRDHLSVFGDDYDTPDGTGVRDYIHVMDLAAGHLAAMRAIAERGGCRVWNLGTGRGYSVLEVVDAFQRVTGQAINYEIAPRRAGDVAACWADPARAERELGWRAQRGLDEIVRDAWRWQRDNPDGYRATD
jgi:UDP-glucose 4-epimerase